MMKLTGDLDLKVNPRLGLSFSGTLAKVFGANLLIKTATDFIALPIDVTVQGPDSNIEFGVLARAPGVLEELTGNVTGRTTGAVLKEGKKVGGGVIKGAGVLLKRGESERDAQE